MITEESAAVSAIISTAPADGDTSPENMNRARRKVAAALRSWRRSGKPERAKWFRSHVAFLGYPFKPTDTQETHTRRRAFFIFRNWTKNSLPVPQWALDIARP